MRIRGGKYSAFESSIVKTSKDLAKQLTRAQNILFQTIQTAVLSPEQSAIFWSATEKKINLIYNKMYKDFKNYYNHNLPIFYRKQLAKIQRDIANTKNILNTANKTIKELQSSKAVNQYLNLLLKDTLLGYASSLDNGKKNVLRLVRKTQQSVMQDSAFSSLTSKAFQKGSLTNFWAIVKNDPEYKTLLDMHLNKRYVQAGSYKYKVKYYTKMVIRTRFHESHTNAALTQAANHETDLILVSSHNTTTKICQPFEGKIFSLTGKNKMFPILDQTPPFHPNCLHLIYPYFESALLATGTLQSMSDFSLGKTDKPPFPAAFIPLSDRVA